MEPISLIVAALVAGATAATQETVKTVISDSYQGLKSLIKNKLSKGDEIEVIESDGITNYSKDSIAKIINENKLHELPEILESAKNVVELIKNESSMQGVYNTHIQGEIKGLVQGNNNTVTLNF